jgi:hypothetical protein
VLPRRWRGWLVVSSAPSAQDGRHDPRVHRVVRIEQCDLGHDKTGSEVETVNIAPGNPGTPNG